jgi:DNA-binding LytR/AlgR family response regulator
MPDKNSPTPDSVLHSILARACDLRDGIALALSVSDRSDSQIKAFSLVSGRLETTVIRPLRGAIAEMRAAQESEMNVRTASASRLDDSQPVLSITALGDELWALAKDATALQVNAKMPAQTKEAAAGLQYLACELVTIRDGANGTSSTAARLSELKAIQAELSTGIQAESNGPHLVTNGERLFNWLGERAQATYETRFLVRTGRRVTIVPVEDIDWIEAAGDYVTLHVGNKSHMLRQTMSGLEVQLDPDHFIRVHRSAIVQASRICELESLPNREYLLRLSDGTKVRTSRRFSDRIERWLC